jgi:hypothetical protein
MDQVSNPDKSCTIPQSKAYKAVIKAHYEYTALSQEGSKVYEAVVWPSLGPLPRWVPGPTTR